MKYVILVMGIICFNLGFAGRTRTRQATPAAVTLLGLKAGISKRVTAKGALAQYVDPEVAHIGLTPEQWSAKLHSITQVHVPFYANGSEIEFTVIRP